MLGLRRDDAARARRHADLPAKLDQGPKRLEEPRE
jgi:hypothetical protein